MVRVPKVIRPRLKVLRSKTLVSNWSVRNTCYAGADANKGSFSK